MQIGGWTLLVLSTAGFAFFTLVASDDVKRLSHQTPSATNYMRYRATSEGRPAESYTVCWTALDSMSPLLPCAVVNAEDPKFFRHSGFDWKELTRAGLRIVLTGKVRRGGSTITQQLARNLYLSPKRTLWRKLREAIISKQLENALPKRRILELYLNLIEWAPSTWGVTSASAFYFDKGPRDLDAFEATFLAGLIPSPRQPLSGENLERIYSVQVRVLRRLYFSGAIGAGEWKQAMARANFVKSELQQGLPLKQALTSGVPTSQGPSLLLPTEYEMVPRNRLLDENCGTGRQLLEDVLR